MPLRLPDSGFFISCRTKINEYEKGGPWGTLRKEGAPAGCAVFFTLPELFAVLALDVDCQLEQHTGNQTDEQINGMKAGQRICKGCAEHGKAICQLVDECCAGSETKHGGDLIRKVKSADGSPPNWKWRCPERLKPKGAPPGKRASRRCRPPPATKWRWIPRTSCSARRRGSGKALSHRHLGKRPGSLPRLFERAGHFADRR